MTLPQITPSRALQPGEPVLLYGAGSFGAEMVPRMRGLGHAVEGFVDLKSGRSELAGVPVFNQPGQLDAAKRALPLVIAIYNRDVNHAQRKAQLAPLGFARMFSFAELPDQYRPDRFWLAPRGFFQAHAREIAALDQLLEDEGSKSTLRALLDLRLNGSDGAVLTEERQYFIEDFLDPARALRWLDCGSYNGDTIVGALHLGYRIDALAAFEPDPANFAALARTMDAHMAPHQTAALYPCGVWSRNEYLSFASGGGEASALSTGAAGAVGEPVQCVALDATVKWLAPNFIKMDIEGAEVDALRGAQEIIRQFRPALAISAYHRPADLWEIPLLIRDIAPDYRFRLRSHGMFGFDSILYASPAAH